MKHPRYINYNGSLEDLAEELGNLQYDTLAEFLSHLTKNLLKQSNKDKIKGRIKLSNNLVIAASAIGNAKSWIEGAWKICEPYMKDKNE